MAVEIYPKSKWLRGYKTTDMADILDDPEAVEDIADQDDQAIKAKQSLLQ